MSRLRRVVISPVPVLLPLTILRIVGKIQCRNDKPSSMVCKKRSAIFAERYMLKSRTTDHESRLLLFAGLDCVDYFCRVGHVQNQFFTGGTFLASVAEFRFAYSFAICGHVGDKISAGLAPQFPAHSGNCAFPQSIRRQCRRLIWKTRTVAGLPNSFFQAFADLWVFSVSLKTC